MAKPKLNLKALEGVEDSYDERPTRPCMSCGQNDKAPRSQAALADGNTAYYHIDCHAMLGDKVSQRLLKELGTTSSPDGLKNEDLWLEIVDKSNLNPTSDTLDVFKVDDVTGTYQAALNENAIQDDTWEKK